MQRYARTVSERLRRPLSRTLVRLAMLVCVVACDESTPTNPGTDTITQKAAPALIDREVFFGSPSAAYAQLSPDGERLAFAKPWRGKLNLWVKDRGAGFDTARPVTAGRERPITDFFWSTDSRWLLYLQDQGGDENVRLYRVDTHAAAGRVPPAHDLTPFDGVRTVVYALSDSEPAQILVGLNRRDPSAHDLYRLNLHTGALGLLRKNPGSVAHWFADRRGEPRLAARSNADGEHEILRLDADGMTPIYRCGALETCRPLQFHADGHAVYVVTNAGERDLAELVLLDIVTGAETFVARDPEAEVDFGSALFSRATGALLAVQYDAQRRRNYAHAPEFGVDLERLRQQLPDGDLGLRSPTRNDRYWLVKQTLDVDNGPNYIYDRSSGELQLAYRPFADIPVERMAAQQSVRIRTRDGISMPAYLTLPVSASPPLPAVVLVHGGPWSRVSWGWDSMTQFLASRGYAVLTPNFRGSTGYGKRYVNLGNGQWGTGSMQHDLSDAAQWLVEEDIADPAKIAIMGTSYGGYAALAGAAFTPERFAAAVSIVGPSNLLTLLDSIPAYWAPLRVLFATRLGDPAIAADRERLAAQSPLNSAEQIVAPLLVVQGANDPRVKRAESDRIVAALYALGREVDYLVAPDEGHGLANSLNELAATTAIESFLAEHLGGARQTYVRPQVAARLKALRVDPASVAAPR